MRGRARSSVLVVLQADNDGARGVVDAAEAEARRLGHERVGTEHLVLGLLTNRGRAGDVLRAAGATIDAARHKVAEAVPAGDPAPGQLARTARAERALERAARFARRDREPMGPEHLLLGVLDVEGLGCQVLRGLGVDVAHLRDAVAAGPAASPMATEAASIDAAPLRCPACRVPLEVPLPARDATVRPERGAPRAVLVPHCPGCGAVLGVLAP